MKLSRIWIALGAAVVAPRAGAWIETEIGAFKYTGLVSPPARGRGLKLVMTQVHGIQRMSPPARGRGLKPSEYLDRTRDLRRPPRGGVD